MLSIYLKELLSYLTSMIGYVFMAFMLCVIGLYFGIYNLSHGYPELGVTLSSTTFLFMIVVPILTMRILAEEKRQRTDQLLFSAPVSIPGIVIGKYAALLTIFAIPMVLICFYPIILNTYGTINFAVCLTAILGYFLMGAATLAIGLFASSLTESQVISAVVCFGIIFLTYVVSGLEDYVPTEALQTTLILAVVVILAAALIYNITKSILIAVIAGVVAEIALAAVYLIKSDLMAGLLQKILTAFEMTTHLENFFNGMIDVKGIIYYVSVAVLFLFLTIQSLQKRRWS